MAYDRTLLKDEEVNAFLQSAQGWSREGDVLRKRYQFATFLEGIAFVTAVAHEAEKANHHPDIDIRYREVTLALTTHDAKGLTFRDVDLARACDALFR